MLNDCTNLTYFQDHYDFGMRAVKTVISAAGNLKRENPEMSEVTCFLQHHWAVLY